MRGYDDRVKLEDDSGEDDSGESNGIGIISVRHCFFVIIVHR